MEEQQEKILIDKLNSIIESVIESNIYFDNDYEYIDYYNTFCKAASNNCLYKFMGYDVCVFNIKYENEDAVIFIFYIPTNVSIKKKNNIPKKMIDIIGIFEKVFIKLDYYNAEEINDEKFIYMKIINKIK